MLVISTVASVIVLVVLGISCGVCLWIRSNRKHRFLKDDDDSDEGNSGLKIFDLDDDDDQSYLFIKIQIWRDYL